MIYLKKCFNVLMICFMCLFICYFAFTIESDATTYNETENNNYAGNADSISVNTGVSVNGYLSKNDVDWFKFTLDKGSEVCLKSYLYGNKVDMVFRVYSEKDVYNNKYCIEEDVDYNYNLGYAYAYDKLYLGNGTYYLVVESYDDTGSYTLKFTNTTGYESFSEPNTYISQATTISSGKTYKGVLTGCANRHIDVYETQDIDMFKLVTPSSGYYYFTMYNVNSKYCFATGGFQTTSLNYSGNEANRFINSKYDEKYATTYTDAGKRETVVMKLPKGTTYLRVEGCYAGKYKMSVTRKPSKVYYPDATRYGSKSIKIKWKKNSGVTGYKVYRSTNKNSGFKLIKTIKDNSKTYYIDKNKTKGRTYYYKICAYKYVNGYSCKGYYSRIESIKR